MLRSQPDGYLAVPGSGRGPGVLVLHAWWGLSDTIKEVCDRLAQEGYVAYAPDLYHSKFASTIAEAEVMVEQLDPESAKADIAEGVNQLWERTQPRERGLGVVGFYLGANFALNLSTDDPGRVHAVVLFYGTGGGDFSRAKAAYLGHFAGKDPYEPAEGVDELERTLKSAGRPVTFYRYPSVGHWFFEPDRPDAYEEGAARLAWDRTAAFLRNSLSPSPADLPAGE
jgi:carboxymethylenebutenolidase